MIKKIICPVDFSKVSDNATSYAAKLAQSFGAELVLINVEELAPVPVSWSVLAGASINAGDRIALVSERLKETSEELNKLFGISCSYDIEPKKNSLAQAISTEGAGNTIIAMGTNGADNLYQVIFGSNTFNVIKKAECPVLVIPEYCLYTEYKKILFFYSEKEKDTLELKTFNEFTESFHAETDFIEVCEPENEKYETLSDDKPDEVNKLSGQKIEAEGKLFAEYTAETIDEFQADHPADLLVLQAREDAHLASTFHRKLIKNLCTIATYPVLVLH